jgi:hypothetical protein
MKVYKILQDLVILLKMAVFWVVASCYHRFRGTCCLSYQSVDF